MSRRGLVNCSIDGRGNSAPIQTSISPMTFATDNAGNVQQHIGNEMFVTLYRFLNSLEAQGLGIHRRAYFAGGQSSNLMYPMPEDIPAGRAGTGMNYWDEANPVGNHAWAIFEFTLGSPSFWVLIQWGASNTVSSNTGWDDSNAFGLSGSIGTIGVPYISTARGNFSQTNLLTGSSYKPAGVGLAVGMMNDGSSPWNGTTNNNGSDTKSLPVWKSDAMVWPRANNERGMYASNRELLFGLLYETNAAFAWYTNSSMMSPQEKIRDPDEFDASQIEVPVYDTSDVLYHTIIEEDKICILTDMMGCGHYNFFYFGPYKPYHTGSISPRVALYKYANNNDASPILTVGTNRVYGGFDAGFMNSANQYDDQTMGETSYFQGGISHPLSATVVGCSIDTIPYNSIHDNPRKFQGSYPSSPWMLTNPIVYMNEFPERRAILGEIEWFKLTTNCRSHTLFSTGSLAAFGNPAMSSFKAVVPWFTGTIPGIYGARRGFIQ